MNNGSNIYNEFNFYDPNNMDIFNYDLEPFFSPLKTFSNEFKDFQYNETNMPVSITSSDSANIKNENNLEQIDNIVSSAQSEIKTLYYQYDFDGIINFLNVSFPFFLNRNQDVLYTLTKMKFFYLILANQKDAALNYYDQSLKLLLKETRRRNWKRKEKVFIKLINNPNILKNKNILDSNYEPFIIELVRELYNFLVEGISFDQMEGTLHNMNTASRKTSESILEGESYSIPSNGQRGMVDLDEFDQRQNTPLTQDQYDNIGNIQENQPNDQCDAEQDIQNLSQFSTKEEFSDFEEEIAEHEACHAQMEEVLPNEIHSVDSITQSNVSTLSSTISKKFNNLDQFVQFSNEQNFKPLTFNPTVLTEDKQSQANNNSLPEFDPIQDASSTFNLHKKTFLPKQKNNEISLQKKLPLLKSFKPKYTKRENIDKKILRRFKFFLKETKWNIKNSDQHFWIMFTSGNLFPPVKYHDNITEENVDFKSFNAKYMLWLFGKIGARELYEEFIKQQGKDVVAELSADYKLTSEVDMKQLENYINNLPFIFDSASLGHCNETNPTAPNPVNDTKAKSMLRRMERSRNFNDLDIGYDDFLSYRRNPFESDEE